MIVASIDIIERALKKYKPILMPLHPELKLQDKKVWVVNWAWDCIRNYLHLQAVSPCWNIRIFLNVIDHAQREVQIILIEYSDVILETRSNVVFTHLISAFPNNSRTSPNPPRTSQNHAFGTCFLYLASSNKCSLLSPPQSWVNIRTIQIRVFGYGCRIWRSK